MTQYALVEHGAVTDGPRFLRGSWRNTTNMECLSADELKALGWLPLVESKPPLGEHEKYGGTSDSIAAEGVTRTWAVLSKTSDEIEAYFIDKLDAMFDDKAAERRYSTRYTCAARAGYVGPFQAEGTAFAQWMDACNQYGYGVVADVLAGRRAVPSWDQLKSELPTLTWPN